MRENHAPFRLLQKQLAALLVMSGAVAQGPTSEPWKAPGYAARKVNPVAATAQSLETGKVFFTSLCSACHGNEGKGDGPAAAALNPKPRDLTKGDWHQQTDGSLFWKLQTGRTPMPGFAGAMTAEQTWQVVQFLRSIQPSDSKVPERLPKHAATDESLRRVSITLARYGDLVEVVRSGQLKQLAAVRARLKDAADKLGSPGSGITGKALVQWEQGAAGLAAVLTNPSDEPHTELHQLTERVVAILGDFGHADSRSVWLFRYEKARKGSGGVWLQRTSVAENPFAGGEDQKLGDAKEVFPPVRKVSAAGKQKPPSKGDAGGER